VNKEDEGSDCLKGLRKTANYISQYIKDNRRDLDRKL
jgi:hypothetical protein